MTRTGKIARLPRAIRAELNRRLRDGVSGRQIIEWLNLLPETRAVLKRDFDSRDISDQNLSDWKLGGYREWLAQQEALGQAAELAADAGELREVAGGTMADHLATVLTARYAAALAAFDGDEAGQVKQKLRPLRDLCHDVVELRRGDHDAARLKIEQARLEHCQEKTEEEIVEYLLRWIEYPKVRDCISDPAASHEVREKRLRELLGIVPAKAPLVLEVQGNST